MRVLLSLLLAVYLFTPPTHAQQPAPARQAQDEEPIRISTELVQTDMTVTDSRGRFVDNLRREQFELFVDGRTQEISFFELVAAGSSREAALMVRGGRALAPAAKEPAGAPTAVRGRTVFFFVDDLHLSPGSLARTRETLLRFVEGSMGPQDQALIATASGQLRFLQQLTGDRKVLRMAIAQLTYRETSAAEKVGAEPINENQAIAIESGDRDALSFFADKQCEDFKRVGKTCGPPSLGMSDNAVFDSRAGSAADTQGRINRAEAERSVKSRARVIARLAGRVILNTLGSLESLVRTATQIPERKVLIFISDGFFLNMLDSSSLYDMRRVTDAALRSGTVIYTVDARGLVTGTMDAGTKGGMDTQGRLTRLAIREATASQDPLFTLAAETGGRAWLNSNDLAPGLVRAVEETSAYYLLAWRPETPAQRKDAYRKIEVKIKGRPDLQVRVRGGFFEDGMRGGNAAATKPATPDEELLSLIRAPFPRRGLTLTLSAGHMDVAGTGKGIAASMLIGAEALGAEGADVDAMSAAINERGDVVSSLKQHIPASAPNGRRGLVFTMYFSGLAPGLYQVRVAAREARTGRAGSMMQWVEVPDTPADSFSLSSLFLTEVPAGAGTGAERKATINPDRRFAHTSRLRFQAYVYNTARAGARPDLTLELQLSRGDQTLIATPPNPVPTEGVIDLARVPLTGEFPLDGFPPGLYTMKIIVTDRAAGKSVTQHAEFTVETGG